jgi:hypothetical protein
VVPYAKYCESSIVVAVAVAMVTARLEAPERYGAEGAAASVMFRVNDCWEVPPEFRPRTVIAYDIDLYAPMTFTTEPERDAEFWGLVASM